MAPHYPLIWMDGSLYNDKERQLVDNETSFRKDLEHYIRFCKGSYDAMDYVWHTLDKFIVLASNIRFCCRHREEIAEIKPEDIIDFKLS